MKKLSSTTIFRLILLTSTFCFFLACSKEINMPVSLQEFKAKEGESASKASIDYWAIPEQYKDVPIEQIKAQVEITEYKTMKGAASNAGTELMTREGYNSLIKGGGKVPAETPKNKADREALAAYINKLISLEGVVALGGSQKTSPLDIKEREPGKYEIWFCDKTRKPCRYQALLLYSGPEGKGNTLFTHDNVIRFWGVMLGEEIIELRINENIKRYPKIVVIDLEIIE